MNERIELLIKLGLSPEQARDFCFNLGEDSFNAARKWNPDDSDSKNQLNNGFEYFEDYFDSQIKK